MPHHVTVPCQVTVRKADADANGHSASDVPHRDAGKVRRQTSRSFVAPESPLLEIKPVYATLDGTFFPRCNTTKIMCSEFSATEDSSTAIKSMARARV